MLLLDLLSERLTDPCPKLSGTDWARIVTLAKQQRVLPCLEPALDKAGLALPAACAIAPATRRGWQMRALSLQAETLRVHTLLQDAGIAHVFLKGIVLAAFAYPNPAMRPMRDLDLLVRPTDLPRARKILALAGGELQHMAHKSAQNAPEEAKHATPVWSPGQVVSVELHGHLTEPFADLDPHGFARFEREIWDRATTVSLGGHDLPCLAPEDMCLHLVMHGLYDHELNNGPVFVTDLLHLLRASPLDAVALQKRAVDLGIADGLALSLSLLPHGLVAAQGFDLDGRALPRDMAAALLFQDGRFRTDLRLAADLAERGTMARFSLLLRKVFAPRHTMLDRWHREQGHEAPAPAAPRLWVWFLRTRRRQMRAAQGRSDSQLALGPDKLRAHLLDLRALRTGRK
ncbi:hypothetical protein ROE7235_02100 [Roseibaca ekhonensis]|uniref:Nucleotidyltransferase family protein n=2 Tax=Roseinatronobacter ekhonensis TaxID=254356 RepID=A0A3B0MU52_9RHOB|nr:hypothetical protein ROE7235_02100 [Roseibaca ekhonensis]